MTATLSEGLLYQPYNHSALEERRLKKRKALARQRIALLLVLLCALSFAATLLILKTTFPSLSSSPGPTLKKSHLSRPLIARPAKRSISLRQVRTLQAVSVASTTRPAATTPTTPPVSQGAPSACRLPGDYRGAFDQANRETGLAISLIGAVAKAESQFDQSALSSQGAIGVMQLMPATARAMSVNANNEYENIVGGARYLKNLLERLGSQTLAIAAYNAGPYAVERYHGVPPYQETENYLARVGAYQSLFSSCD